MTVETGAVTDSQESGSYREVLSLNERDGWVVSLPPALRLYQRELEDLLGKVFAGRPNLPANVALAQQMSLNWCVSKCHEVGISFEDSWLSISSTR